MTIQDLYDWAKEHNALNEKVVLITEIWGDCERVELSEYEDGEKEVQLYCD